MKKQKGSDQTSADYREINKKTLETMGECWSIENMAAHGAGGRSRQYIGSRKDGDVIYDYYQDSARRWWFGNRGIRNGVIVSMEEYIFGHKVAKEGKYKRY